MKRILFSLVMIAATVGVVTASAFALFTDTADVKGVSISSGNAYLKVNGADSVDDANWFNDHVYPGWINGKYFYLTNASTSDIDLNLVARLSGASGDWGSLKDKVNVALVEYTNSTDALAAISAKNPSLKYISSTGWKSLSDWYATTPKDFGQSLGHGVNHYFVFWSQVSSTADNSISGKSVNTNWILTGTQKQ